MFFEFFIEMYADPLESAREIVRYLEEDLSRKTSEIELLKAQLGMTERHEMLGDEEIKRASETNGKLQSIIRSFGLLNVRSVDVNNSSDQMILLKLDGENDALHLQRYYAQSDFHEKVPDYIFPKTGVISRFSKNVLDPKKLYDKFVLIKILINVGLIGTGNRDSKAQDLEDYIRENHADLMQFLNQEKQNSPFKSKLKQRAALGIEQ